MKDLINEALSVTITVIAVLALLLVVAAFATEDENLSSIAAESSEVCGSVECVERSK